MSARSDDMFALVARGAEARVRGRRILGPLDLTLEGSGTTVMIGPNGAGKTTLLKLLHGIMRLGAGEVRWACGEAAARARQGFVFQTPMMMRRSVCDNIAYPLRLVGVPRAEARQRAADWAGRVGLGDMLARRAPLLSGGAGMGAALNTASGLDAYILTDRGSWLNVGNKGGLALLYSGDPALFNQYAYLPVNPARHPHVKAAEARRLEAWLVSDRARALINGYRIGGEQLFTFNAAPG